MKIRNGFVTNSSSSSFIIARHKDFDMEDLRKLFSTPEMIENIKSIGRDYREDIDDIPEFIDEVVNQLFNYHGMNLGDWIVSSDVFCNDDGVVSGFIYEYLGNLNTEKFKTES